MPKQSHLTITITGPMKSGKTTVATIIASTLLEKGFEVFYQSACLAVKKSVLERKNRVTIIEKEEGEE